MKENGLQQGIKIIRTNYQNLKASAYLISPQNLQFTF